jgi:hypothetical protein
MKKKKKAKIALSFASPEKEKYFLFIYEVITWEKKNALLFSSCEACFGVIMDQCRYIKQRNTRKIFFSRSESAADERCCLFPNIGVAAACFPSVVACFPSVVAAGVACFAFTCR